MPKKTIELPVISSCTHIAHGDGYIIGYLPPEGPSKNLALFVPAGKTEILIINLMHTDDD
jgi:hypothetical protein